jgi:hypothetical protein
VHHVFTDFKKAYDSGREVLHIPFEFGMLMKLVMLIKMCLNETYSRVWVGQHLSDMFPMRNSLKQGAAPSPLLFNSALEYTLTLFTQVNQDGLKLDATHQLLVYADDVNILGEIIHTQIKILFRKKLKLD